MMVTSDIKTNISTYVIEYLVKESGIVLEDDTSFLEKGIIDSTGVMELVAFLEETFGIRVEDDEIVPEIFDSISRLVNYVQLKLPLESYTVTNNSGE
jgi:acyl carrier protein